MATLVNFLARGPAPWLERGAAWLLFVNGLLALTVAFAAMPSARWLSPAAWPLLALLGLGAGVLSLRGYIAGVWGGAAYYAPQVFSYYAYSNAWSFSVKSGLSLAAVLRLSEGVLVVNVLALVLLIVSAAILYRRLRRSPDGRGESGE